MGECFSDSNCSGVQICYVDPKWSNETNFCGCESWYGWNGDDCLGLSFGSVVLLFSALIGGLLGLIGFILAMEQFKRMQEKNAKSGKSRFQVNTAGVTLSLVAFAFFCFMVWRFNLADIILTPQDHTAVLVSNGVDDVKLHENVVLERFTVGFAILATACALLEVSLVWLEIAENNIAKTDIVRTKKYRRVINGTQLFFLLIYTIGAATGAFALLTLLALPVLVMVMVTFGYARKLMLENIAPLISVGEVNTGAAEHIVRSVKKVTSRIIFFGSFGLIGGLIYTILSLIAPYRNIIPENTTLNVVAFFFEWLAWSVFGCLYTLLDNLYDRGDDSLVAQFKVIAATGQEKVSEVMGRSENTSSLIELDALNSLSKTEQSRREGVGANAEESMEMKL